MGDDEASLTASHSLVARAMADPDFRQALVDDPEQALRDAGIHLSPEEMEHLTSMSREEREQMADQLDTRQSSASYGVGALFGDTDSEIHARD